MGKMFWAIATVVLLSTPGCRDAGPSAEPSTEAPREKDALVSALAQPNVFILDVRSKGEFAGGHVDGAVNVPVGDIDGFQTVMSDKSRPIVVHCAAGARSATATTKLRAMGYTHIVDAKTPEAVAKAQGKPLVK